MRSRICKLLGFKVGGFKSQNTKWEEGATVPTDGTAGYAVGCIFIHTDGTVNTTLYINEGSATSCDFNAAISN